MDDCIVAMVGIKTGRLHHSSLRMYSQSHRTLLAIAMLAVVTLGVVEALAACPPVGSPPGGARVVQPGQVPRQCTDADAPFNSFGATYGYYWSENSCRWVAGPLCHARWGYLQASPSQVAEAGDTVTVTAIPDDPRMAGFVKVQGGMSWRYPGTVVSGCGTTDVECTVRLPDPNPPSQEWTWYEFHVSGPGRVFILPPSYAPRCQPEAPCLDTYTNAWSYVGVDPTTPELTATLRANPSQVTIGEPFKVTLRVSNPFAGPLSNVRPAGTTFSGTGQVRVTAGPTPASVATLAPGASADFVWEYETIAKGGVLLKAQVEATTSAGDAVSADAKCGLGGTPASIAGAANDEPCATCEVCDVSGGARVEIVPCKLELHDFSPPMLLARLGPDSTPNPGSNYPPGGT